MLERYLRTALLGAFARTAGLRVSEGMERWIAGGRALSVRSKIAHRALMTQMFRQVKRHRR